MTAAWDDCLEIRLALKPDLPDVAYGRGLPLLRLAFAPFGTLQVPLPHGLRSLMLSL
jgi:hypothetical protein